MCFGRQLSLGWDCHPEGSDRKACIHRGHLMSTQRLMETDLFQKVPTLVGSHSIHTSVKVAK